ncbi:hypothetical protein Vretifemale_15528 [Volvox reticuliferus]|uniref:Uncharacterized protein n=2 Tax=Volvox reticuliferus TaxID=1737510 RepID=A0A8J4CV33_9CHLO|nr:hypothetical protein Vretifemale_14053 [Volvox reticuliferus]GIL87412.1 hypothetical protein Vretifemale_15528 [Volvox reticuliferus]
MDVDQDLPPPELAMEMDDELGAAILAAAANTGSASQSDISAPSLRTLLSKLRSRTAEYLSFVEGIEVLVQNYLVPNATEAAGMAAAAATTDAAAAGTSAGPSAPPHTGHEDEDMGADEDPLDETPAPPPKRPRTASARTDTNGQEGQPREGKGAGKSKRGGQKGKNLAPKEGQVQKGHKGKDPMEFLGTFKCTRREFLHRKQKGICLRCGSDQHRVDTCPIMLAEDPKGKGH